MSSDMKTCTKARPAGTTHEEKDESQTGKRLKERRHLQKFLTRAWPRKSSATDQHPGYGNARKCPQCAVIRMRVKEDTVCAHGFDAPCFYCHGNHGVAAWRCLECEINLCYTDLSNHVRMPLLSTHRIVLRHIPDGMMALGKFIDRGYTEIFYKDWMMAANIILTCDEQEYCEPSCSAKKCDVRELHDIDCPCSREPCTCEPIELDYVIYMNDRQLEKAYNSNFRPKIICIQCEIERRHENYNSMKRLKRAKKILNAEAHSHDLNTKLNKLAQGFCSLLNQPAQRLPPPQSADDSLPELTDTDEEGGPLEDDLNDIKPGVIVCEHNHDRQARNPPYLLPNSRPKLQADLENDPSFQYFSPPASDSESPSSDSDSSDIDERLEKILAQASQFTISGVEKEIPTESKPTKSSKSKRKRKSKAHKGMPREVSNVGHETSKAMETKTNEASPDVATEVPVTAKPKDEIQSKLRKQSQLSRDHLKLEEKSPEYGDRKETHTFNQTANDFLGSQAFNEQLNSPSHSEQLVSTSSDEEENPIELKVFKKYAQFLKNAADSDVELWQEDLATKHQEVVETTLSEIAIQRNITEANHLSTLMAQTLHDQIDKDGQPLLEPVKEVTEHKSNTVSLRVLNKTQRFAAGEQPARDHVHDQAQDHD